MKIKAKLIILAAAFLAWLPGCEQPTLTKQEIIDIANRTATARGLDLKEYLVHYDEANVQSRGKVANVKGDGSSFDKMFKTLKSKDTQAVLYKRKGTRGPKGTHTFFINRKTGDVLGEIKER
ncbi:MAG: hypothetical protein ACYSSO_00850 [Planctomycetota bacterium]